jgi:hypothetical protein
MLADVASALLALPVRKSRANYPRTPRHAPRCAAIVPRSDYAEAHRCPFRAVDAGGLCRHHAQDEV